jgi:hypothetical protein
VCAVDVVYCTVYERCDSARVDSIAYPVKDHAYRPVLGLGLAVHDRHQQYRRHLDLSPSSASSWVAL